MTIVFGNGRILETRPGKMTTAADRIVFTKAEVQTWERTCRLDIGDQVRRELLARGGPTFGGKVDALNEQDLYEVLSLVTEAIKAAYLRPPVSIKPSVAIVGAGEGHMLAVPWTVKTDSAGVKTVELEEGIDVVIEEKVTPAEAGPMAGAFSTGGFSDAEITGAMKLSPELSRSQVIENLGKYGRAR